MPDFTAGNPVNTVIPEETVTGYTGYILPEVNPPSQPTDSNIQGSHVVTSTAPPEEIPAEVPAQIRPGDSPDDRSAPSQYPGDQAVPPDTAGGSSPRGRESFATDNDEATPTFQRSSEAWTGAVWQVTDKKQIVGRMSGRTSTTLYVPPTDEAGGTILGVRYAYTESMLEGPVNTCPFLLPGAGVTILSEGPVWVAPLSGNATGFVVVFTTDNPSGGQLGGL